MSAASTKENKLGIMPINRLLIDVSLPIMISMFVQALYNIVDSIFVARINENALTAVSLAYPVQSLIDCSGNRGGDQRPSVQILGEKDFDKANRVATNSIFLGVLSFLDIYDNWPAVFTDIFCVSDYDAEIVGYGVTYLSIVCIGSIGKFMQIVFERLLRYGKTVYSMIAQATGACSTSSSIPF